MICIGYAGYEAFDVILYIARTITKLKYRVLIVDLSNTGALNRTIKHGMDLDSKKDIIYYRDINYTRKVPSEGELEMFREGVVIVVYGSNYVIGFPIQCNTINIVVNTFPHVIKGIDLLLQNIAKNEDSIRLLIRDVVTVDDVDQVKNNMKLPDRLDDISYLYLDLFDYTNAVNCQNRQLVKFTRISAKMIKYITNQIHAMFPQIRPAKIRKAVVMARRGV